MLRGANIICLSSIDWNFNWQNPQEIASAFAATDNRVLFIENTGVRRCTPSDASRLWKRFQNWRRARHGLRPLGNGIDVHSPLLIPLPYSRIALYVNVRLLGRVIRRWLSVEHERPLVLITFLPTPLTRALVRLLRPGFIIYYCIDKIAESSPAARKLHDSEPELIAEVDLVLITAENLRSPAMRSTHVESLPSGVRFQEFEEARRNGSRPSLFDDLKGPIVGFSGTVRNRTDITLLSQVVALAPDLTFLFVGPVMVDVKHFADHPNVHFIGAVPHDELIRIMTCFDAGILPYVLDEFTAGIMPAKLKEYLAAGLPIVSTRLPEVCRFAEKHPGVVAFASEALSFVDALRKALSENDPATVDRRLEVARQYEWSVQLAAASDLVEQMMNAKR